MPLSASPLSAPHHAIPPSPRSTAGSTHGAASAMSSSGCTGRATTSSSLSTTSAGGAFYVTGMEHSATSATASAFEDTPWRAAQRAAWQAITK
jgi:hypothetical protein